MKPTEVDRLHANARQFGMREICRMFDIPPWLISDCPKPKFARLRWKLRRIWKV